MQLSCASPSQRGTKQWDRSTVQQVHLPSPWTPRRPRRAHSRAVPGAGGGYDALALAAPGREVVGLDLAQTAVENARRLQGERGVSADLCSFVQGDFFAADVVRFRCAVMRLSIQSRLF